MFELIQFNSKFNESNSVKNKSEVGRFHVNDNVLRQYTGKDAEYKVEIKRFTW